MGDAVFVRMDDEEPSWNQTNAFIRMIFLCLQLVLAVYLYKEMNHYWDEYFDIVAVDGEPETNRVLMLASGLVAILFASHGGFLVLGGLLEVCRGKKGLHTAVLASPDLGFIRLITVALPLFVLATQYRNSNNQFFAKYTTLSLVLLGCDFLVQMFRWCGGGFISSKLPKRLFSHIHIFLSSLISTFMAIHGFKMHETFNGINYKWVVAIIVGTLLGLLDSDSLNWYARQLTPLAKTKEQKMEAMKAAQKAPGSGFLGPRLTICALAILVCIVPHIMYVVGFCDQYFHDHDALTRVLSQFTIYSLLVCASLLGLSCCLGFCAGCLSKNSSS